MNLLLSIACRYGGCVSAANRNPAPREMRGCAASDTTLSENLRLFKSCGPCRVCQTEPDLAPTRR
jgi:hypothetical protein